MKACEDHNDGSLGRRIAEASRAARGAAEPDRRPDVGFGAKHIAARAVVESLPPGRPPVGPMEHAALREAYERVRAVAVAAAGMMSSRVNPRERGRMTAALEDALGRIHNGDLEPWRGRCALEEAHDAQDLAEAHGPHCPAWCPERGKVDRTVSLDEVKATLDAAPPEDLFDATKVPSRTPRPSAWATCARPAPLPRTAASSSTATCGGPWRTRPWSRGSTGGTS